MKRTAVLTAIAILVTMLVPSAALAGDRVEIEVAVAVRMQDGHFDQIEEAAADKGATVTGTLLTGRGVYLVTRPDRVKVDKLDTETAKAAEELVKDMQKGKRVEWAVALAHKTGGDRFHAWPADASPVSGPTGPDPLFLSEMGIEAAHARTTGRGVVVAVLDTGVDADHPLLTGRLAPGYDLVGDDPDPSEELDGLDTNGDGRVDEAHGHGTFVAGVIAQVVPDATIIPFRVMDSDGVGQAYAIAEAIRMAVEADADVINLSFGMSNKLPKPVDQAIKDARAADVMVVAAAGNVGTEGKHYPAAKKEVVSVTAWDEVTADLAYFATRGKTVDLAAPGVDIVSSVPGGGYATWAGSSMAAAIVSGQLALMVEYAPNEKPKKLMQVLWKSARKQDGVQHGRIDVLASLDRLG